MNSRFLRIQTAGFWFAFYLVLSSNGQFLQGAEPGQSLDANSQSVVSPTPVGTNWWKLGSKPLPKPATNAIARADQEGHVSWVVPGEANHEVLFEFYSSCEREVKLAYRHELNETWRFERMVKDGNRFYTTHTVDQEIWYEFVGALNVWYRKDPFNKNLDHDHPYLKRGDESLVSHRNLAVTYVPSAHFDYFTTGDGHKIETLESLYRELTGQILTMFGTSIQPVQGKKIRYYGGMFGGRYATAGNAEIVEIGDYPNSHELIHVLMHDYPHYGPFSEGLAQCLQESGNRRPLREGNCSLEAKKKLARVTLREVLSDFSHHSDYHMAGSFIYYHLFIGKGMRQPFVAFLKEFQGGVNPKFEEVELLYRKHLGVELASAMAEWEAWVRQINKSSNIYGDWNTAEQKELVRQEIRPDKVAGSASTKPASNDIVTKRLTELKALFDQGLITQEAYDQKRKEIVNSL